MDPFLILTVIFSTLVFIAIPLFIIHLIFRWLKGKTKYVFAISIYIILLLAYCYCLYISFHPSENFYTDNFKENTSLTFPQRGNLLSSSGNNSIYGFGDYNLSYRYEFSKNDFENLHHQLIQNGFKKNDKYLETSENEKALSYDTSVKIKEIISKDFGFKNFEILFMDDNKTIIFNSNKW